MTSQAHVALVDLRGVRTPSRWIADMARAVDVTDSALVVLVDAADADKTVRLAAEGVTHMLVAPFSDEELGTVLHLAEGVARRLRCDAQPVAPVAGGNRSGMDFLTGLTDRQAAMAWLDHALAARAVSTCLLIGISQFESINAAYGPVVGDALLARAAGRITRIVQAAGWNGALVARMGGAEYLVALPVREDASGQEHALMLARQIHAAVARPFVVGAQTIRLTARCGVAEALAGDDAGRLIRRANGALADARRNGAGDICIRSADRRGRGVDPDRLDADLRLALERGEIGILFQPQYASSDDRIVGVEALARWNHRQLGQLGAAMLFDAAERSDYLLPLSRHIQREALQQAGAWPDALDGLRLSINVTANDIAQEDFLPRLLAMVAESGFPRERLTVEITESGLIQNLRLAGDVLRSLRGEGLRVAIDDFGTGYSSLAYLKALHPDYLKIDSGLTRDIAGAPRDRLIVRGIIAMAKSLALTVVAEGVEREEELALLAREGCDIYQGFLRSAGVESPELVALVSSIR